MPQVLCRMTKERVATADLALRRSSSNAIIRTDSTRNLPRARSRSRSWLHAGDSGLWEMKKGDGSPSTALVAEGPTISSEKTLQDPSLWCPGL